MEGRVREVLASQKVNARQLPKNANKTIGNNLDQKWMEDPCVKSEMELFGDGPGREPDGSSDQGCLTRRTLLMGTRKQNVRVAESESARDH